MQHTTTEVIIAGGGLVGNALALALANAGIHSVVIDPLPREAQLGGMFDGRTSAIALGSVRILDACGAWHYMAPYAQPILDIRVCDQNKPGFVHYKSADVGDEPFGYILENQQIRSGLYQAMESRSEITLRSPSKVVGFEAEPHRITALLDDGARVTAPLMLAADGRFSSLREKAGLESRVISYGQTAIVTVVEHSRPHGGLALESFFPAGPFAVLPLMGNRSGIVWTEADDDAPHYLALPDGEFTAEIEQRMGGAETSLWGKISVTGKRFSYPLKLMHAQQFIAHRFALIGDAAHGIHPIAGQGVNLGYRDVAVLAELLAEQRKLGMDLGSEALLKRYQRWRKFDSVSMTASTDLLNRLFSNSNPLLGLARRAGLVAVEHMPPVKHFFMRHAMGMIGDLPRMMEKPTKAA
jgi:2-octaprenyl-6-methoxyphenol hydroxylase